jgi:hypothetical protein
MNERIRELAEQALDYANGCEAEAWDGAYERKFAELIVRETLNVALYGDEFVQARTNVKTLFGVEND